MTKNIYTTAKSINVFLHDTKLIPPWFLSEAKAKVQAETLNVL